MKKRYSNSRFLKLPRSNELLLHLVLFLSVLSILHYLNIDDIFDASFETTDLYIFVFMSTAFIIHRLFTTHTIVEDLTINYKDRTVEFNYILYFIVKRKLIIPFNEFSFYSRLETIFSGGGLSLRLFKANKFKVKLSHRYGWTKKHIYCINNDFFKMTEGKVRKEVNWQEFYTLVKDENFDCSTLCEMESQ